MSVPPTNASCRPFNSPPPTPIPPLNIPKLALDTINQSQLDTTEQEPPLKR